MQGFQNIKGENAAQMYEINICSIVTFHFVRTKRSPISAGALRPWPLFSKAFQPWLPKLHSQGPQLKFHRQCADRGCSWISFDTPWANMGEHLGSFRCQFSWNSVRHLEQQGHGVIRRGVYSAYAAMSIVACWATCKRVGTTSCKSDFKSLI